ncbi:MAG: M28 family metallopeptidase [Candidatus Binatia bacterium]|nr:M28 family metallopeptidase [Candidatus Binatia bacterium]
MPGGVFFGKGERHTVQRRILLPIAAAVAEPTSWDALLSSLASTPRENGSAELLATAHWLTEYLRQEGWEAAQHWYTAYPLEQRMLGIALLCGGLGYAMCMWRHRFGWAALLALLLPLAAVAQIDLRLPLSWFAPFSQPNVVARLPNREAVETLVFSAHLDTKTDLFDHVTRAPILVFAAPAALLMCAVALGSFVAHQAGNLSAGRQALARILGWIGAIYALALAAVFSGGALLSERSPGALDDGAACAVLARLAHELRATPPQAVEVHLVFFSGEELAAQGAHALLRSWQPGNGQRPVRVVNLDPLGASSEVRVLGSERGFLSGSSPSPEVVAIVDAAHRKLRSSPIETVELIGLTDGWAWRRYGYPAATLFSFVPPFALPRGLHSKEDHRTRIESSALDFSLALMETIVRELDRKLLATGMRGPVRSRNIPTSQQGGERDARHQGSAHAL